MQTSKIRRCIGAVIYFSCPSFQNEATEMGELRLSEPLHPSSVRSFHYIVQTKCHQQPDNGERRIDCLDLEGQLTISFNSHHRHPPA